RFAYVADEYLEVVDGWPVVPGSIAWLGCEITERVIGRYDHDLFFARVVASGVGRTDQPALTYSSRQGWRVAGLRAREKGESVRDRLLERLAHDGPGEAGEPPAS